MNTHRAFRLRSVLTVTTLLCLYPPVTRGSSYTVADLGAADWNANYINALSPELRSAFTASSFDRWAHPAQGDLGPYYSVSFPGTSLPSGWRTHSYAITQNNLGQIVGEANTRVSHIDNPQSQSQAFIYDPNAQGPPWQTPAGRGGQLSDLGPTVLIHFNDVNGINDHGVIVGNTALSGMPAHAFWFQDRRLYADLGTLGANVNQDTSVANAVNNFGAAVGWSGLTPAEKVPGTDSHAFITAHVTDRLVMEDLNSLIPPTSGITLNDAVGINDAGQIVAFGTTNTGATHLYLLDPAPVPEPSTLIFGLLVVAGVGRRVSTQRARTR